VRNGHVQRRARRGPVERERDRILVPLGTAWSGDGSMMVTAVTFLDRKWPHLRRDDDVLLRAHVGRIDDLRWTEMVTSN